MQIYIYIYFRHVWSGRPTDAAYRLYMLIVCQIQPQHGLSDTRTYILSRILAYAGQNSSVSKKSWLQRAWMPALNIPAQDFFGCQTGCQAWHPTINNLKKIVPALTKCKCLDGYVRTMGYDGFSLRLICCTIQIWNIHIWIECNTGPGKVN